LPRLSPDYDHALVEASRSALLELAIALRAYRDGLVLVGGWVPYYLLRDHQLPDNPFVHVGSIDIDLAVDPERIEPREYASIEELITERGWTRSDGRPFSFERTVPSPVDGVERVVTVDLVTTQSERSVVRNRDRELQRGLTVRPFRDVPIALSHRSEVTVDGDLPGGGEVRASILMTDVVGCIGMKGHALGDRYKEKDAYDIWSVVDNYGDGPKEVARQVRPHRREPLIAEALGNIQELFSSPKAAGPRWVADFHAAGTGEARERRRQRAYQVLRIFLEDLR
jgi:hypothetical protein